MTRLVWFRNVLLAAAVVAGACQGDRRENAEEAAERVGEAREALRDEQRDLADEVNERREQVTQERADQLTRDDGVRGMPDRVGDRISARSATGEVEDVTEEARETSEEASALATATTAFEQRRQLRVQELRALHGVLASQPLLINQISIQTPLTDRANVDLQEKMQTFQMRLDEAGNAIHALERIEADGFAERDEAAAEAFDRLEAARDDAWEALRDGDRTDPAV